MSTTQDNQPEDNESILNDIQSLQKMEQELFNTLETNPNISEDERKQIIEKINQLSNMRMNMYKTINNVNTFYKSALQSSVDTLNQQTAAIAIVENELNESKKSLESLEAERNNKIRMVEINYYFSEKYAEHSELMKIVILTLVPVIIVALLNSRGIIPDMVNYILIGLISLIGAIFFWRKFSSIAMRDNMNYEEYNWGPPYTSDTTTTTDDTTETADDPWKSSVVTCVGDACCSDGQTFDYDLNQCVTSTCTANTSSTESFVTDVLTKTSGNNRVSYTINGENRVKPNVASYKI